MFIEILFKMLLFKGGVLIYAEHCVCVCMYVCVYIYIYIYIYIIIDIQYIEYISISRLLYKNKG